MESTNTRKYIRLPGYNNGEDTLNEILGFKTRAVNKSIEQIKQPKRMIERVEQKIVLQKPRGGLESRNFK